MVVLFKSATLKYCTFQNKEEINNMKKAIAEYQLHELPPRTTIFTDTIIYMSHCITSKCKIVLKTVVISVRTQDLRTWLIYNKHAGKQKSTM